MFLLLFICTIFSQCKQSSSQSPKLFNRGDEFIRFCSELKLDTKDANYLLVPPNSCLACTKSATNYIQLHKDSEIIILVPENTECITEDTKNCIPYTYQTLTRYGLLLPYSIVLNVQDSQVSEFRILGVKE